MKRMNPIVPILCVALFVLSGCATSVESVKRTTDQTELAEFALAHENWKVRKAATEKITGQDLLSKIAVEDVHWKVRKTAAEKLTDQALLGKIATEDNYGCVRQAAVEMLVDQALLTRIALVDKKIYVRKAAVEKLTNQSLLAKIATQDGWTVRDAAIDRLTDQALLSKTVEDLTNQILLIKIGKLGDRNSGFIRNAQIDLTRKCRTAALKKITDQELLAKIANTSKDADVCRAAVEKITDQELLAKFAVDSKWLEVRIAAIGKLTDQILLRQWAEQDPRAAIRQASVQQITDDKFLIQRLPLESSAAVRTSIIKTLHGENSLREGALTAYHRKDRVLSSNRLRKVSGDRAADVEKAHENLEKKVKALAGETDNAKLLELAIEGEFDVLRKESARQIRDAGALEQAALRSRDREVLKILLAKLEDEAMLNRIAEAADDGAMRLAAAQKSGMKSWREIFDTATARGATMDMLGDALAAVSLFPTTQSETVDGVQQACLNLIRRGDESRIPEMVDLLEDYGNRILAEDYLNCGQPDLDIAGRAWARRRGYSVDTGSGSHRARWGSGR